MPLFICAKCGDVDNTAYGHYWSVLMSNMFAPDALPIELVNKPLCSECAPPVFGDGGKSGWGMWHNRFSKQSWEVYLGKSYDKKPDDPFFKF